MSLAIKSTAPRASFSEAPLLLLLKLRTFIALFAVVVFFSFAAHNFLSIENLLIMSRHVALNAFGEEFRTPAVKELRKRTKAFTDTIASARDLEDDVGVLVDRVVGRGAVEQLRAEVGGEVV